MKITICTTILLSLLLLSCNPDKGKDKEREANSDVITIDVESVTLEKSIPLSSLFSRVKTIILETTDESLIGSINGMQVCGNSILILGNVQQQGGQLFVFDKEGRFIRKIGGRGQGKGEYLDVSDFTIDATNGEVYLIDSGSDRILKYKLSTGEFIKSITLKNRNMAAFHIQYNNGYLYSDIGYRDNTKDGDACLLQEIDFASGQQKGSWLPASRYNQTVVDLLSRTNESFFYARNEDSFKYILFFADTIISIHKDEIKPLFAIKDKDWVTPEDIRQLREEQKSNSGLPLIHLLISKNKAFNINNYMEWKDYVCFRYQKGREEVVVLYNTKTKETRMTGMLVDDLLFSQFVLASKFGFSDSSGVYGYIIVDRMAGFVERTQNGDFLKPGLDKIEELKKLSGDSNPVIFYYE